MVLVDAGQLFRCAGQQFICVVWFAVFGSSHLLLYHLFHSFLCTIDVPMYTAGEFMHANSCIFYAFLASG